MNRIRALNNAPVAPDGKYVLYWMIATRRPTCNFSLDRAAAWARELGRPLIVLEALRVDYPDASDRLHRFVIDGMAANAEAFASSPARYYPYVEPERGAGKGLIETAARDAAVIVTDEYPCFFLPRMVARAAERVAVRLEAVDSNGLLPVHGTTRSFASAAQFRRYVHRELRSQLNAWPAANALTGLTRPGVEPLPDAVRTRWPAAPPELLAGDAAALARLPIDHTVPTVSMRGGARAGQQALRAFVDERLDRYSETRNHPDARGTSRLSPYLHFGHLSAHEVFDTVMKHERWSVGKLAERATGAREGWWGIAPAAEAFLDQLVVWRELAYNTAATRPDDFDRYDSLPEWARATLASHEADAREHVYSRAELESASTHDRLWNAAQRELVADGWFHNYMRMLWGKKILEWSATPREALAAMTGIMNRWSLDGRDPNSYAGYFWTLGRYDRPWPERPVYGTVRSMSSRNTARKVDVDDYLARFGAPQDRVASTTRARAESSSQPSLPGLARSRRRRG